MKCPKCGSEMDKSVGIDLKPTGLWTCFKCGHEEKVNK